MTADDAYDRLGEVYDRWCVSVTEDIGFYVDLALEARGRVLEIGVGSGRVAIPVALAGVPVVGVDASQTMLDLAARKAAPHAVDLTLVRADMRDLPELGSFALILVPFRAFLHLHSDAERLSVLRSLRSRLQPGGALAFDVFHPDAIDIEQTHDQTFEREPGIHERARWDAESRTLELAVTTGDRAATMHLAWVSPQDWRRLLTDAGFEQIEVYGWFDGRPCAPGDTDSVWVARCRAAS
jgi:SAM-dependent methyltransferase